MIIGGSARASVSAVRAGARVLAVLGVVLGGCAGDSVIGDAVSAAPTVDRTATVPSTRTPAVVFAATSTATPQPTARLTSTPTATATAPESTVTAQPTPTETVARTPVSCLALAVMQSGDTQVTDAAVVAAVGEEPEYCRIRARIEPALNFEVRLPANWNRKAVAIGGGGYDGSIPVPDGAGRSPGMLRRGYVTIANDSGHEGTAFDASWALDNSEAVDNFAYLAHHRVLLAAREIVLAHYAQPPRRTYFEGGSSGGREGLIQAQRWPDDYDGIVSRAPALSFTALNLAANRIFREMFGVPGGFLSAAAVGILSRAVLTACDGLDGLDDGIVSNVLACDFDPAVLLCDGTTADCLSAEQLATVEAVFGGLQLDFPLANGVGSHPGYALTGAENAPAGWPFWMAGPSAQAPSSLLFTLHDQFIKYFVTADPGFDSLAFSPTAEAERLGVLSALLDATDADLDRFTARGGKLILWHGWADYAISPYSTLGYYDRVVNAAGGQALADGFVRCYIAPGVDHTATGRGAPIADLLGAVDAWVDEGIAPGDLIAYRQQGGDLIPFRPLCRHPTYPHYSGGPANAAASFRCQSPDLATDLGT